MRSCYLGAALRMAAKWTHCSITCGRPRAESESPLPIQPNQFATPVRQGLKLTLAGKLASAPSASTPYPHTTLGSTYCACNTLYYGLLLHVSSHARIQAQIIQPQAVCKASFHVIFMICKDMYILGVVGWARKSKSKANC